MKECGEQDSGSDSPMGRRVQEEAPCIFQKRNKRECSRRWFSLGERNAQQGTKESKNKMNTRKTVCAISLLLAVVIVLPGLLSAGQSAVGQKLFDAKCARCHAKDGGGKTAIGSALGAADLRSAVVQKLTNAQIYSQIESGKGNMPPFGSGLNKEQINELITYVRSLGKKQAAGKK